MLRPGAELQVSAVIAWEYADLHRRGRLPMAADLATALDALALDIVPLPAAFWQATRLLPYLHGDPVDRMLIPHAGIWMPYWSSPMRRCGDIRYGACGNTDASSVDACACSPYGRTAMNLLLLLSALLSALTGGASAMRAPAAAHAVAVAAAVAEAQAVPARIAARPVQALPRVRQVTATAAPAAFALAAIVPLYASRRRE